MKKKLIITAITGFVSLILGLILAGIGFFSGGIDQLNNVVRPEYKEETYKQLDQLTINAGYNRPIRIIQSPDDLYHVRYHDFKNSSLMPLHVNETEGQLTIDSIVPKFKIDGIMQYAAEGVATHNPDYLELTIEIPKGKTLKKLDTSVDGLLIDGVHIQEIALYGSPSIINSTIDKGSINGGYSQIYVEKSILKNLTVNSYTSSIHISDSQLENTRWENYDSMETSNITVIGDNMFTSNTENSYSIANINLSEKSQKEALLTAEVVIEKKKLFQFMDSGMTDEEIENLLENDYHVQEQLKEIGIFPEDVYKDQKVTGTDDKQSLTVGNKDSKNKLTITATNGTINLGKKWRP
ncbi:DUF4097 domain-containing protein [Streptococcus suis]|nr:DUF4097 domain-containing protein [Streptococcus suis]